MLRSCAVSLRGFDPLARVAMRAPARRFPSAAQSGRATRTAVAERHATIAPSQLVSHESAARHRAAFASASVSAASRSRFADAHDVRHRSAASHFASDPDDDAPAALSGSSNSRVPVAITARENALPVRLTASRDPLATLPSSRLLAKMHLADALVATSPAPLVAEATERSASNPDAVTVRLQSTAHHEKMLFRPVDGDDGGGSGASRASALTGALLMRCRRCANVFKRQPLGGVSSSMRQLRSMTPRARERVPIVRMGRYQKRGPVVPSASFTADPARVNAVACPRCGFADQCESLLQHLHVRNNARKF
jgi:hypothetical protein